MSKRVFVSFITPPQCVKPWTMTVLSAASIFIIVATLITSISSDPVYVRSNRFGQLVTSSSLKWVRGIAKDPVMLPKPDDTDAIVCRVVHDGLQGVGVVPEEQEICTIGAQEGSLQGSETFQTISSTASKLVWTPWRRPNPPPTGSVAVSGKPEKFIAADFNSTKIGYIDPSLEYGSFVLLSDHNENEAKALVLTEVEPLHYDLSNIQLKRNKGFIEEDIVLAYGRLVYDSKSMSPSIKEQLDDSWTVGSKPISNDLDSLDKNDDGFNQENYEDGMGKTDVPRRQTLESVLSYETNNLDYWGQGYLMAKGLHTFIYMPNGNRKILEWGIAITQAGKTETITAKAELLPDTGVNVTLKGTKLDGEMSYWATLKTFFKDGSTTTRLIDGHRKVIEVVNIRLEKSKEYFLSNNSIVEEPVHTTSTGRTTTEDLDSTPETGYEVNVSEEETSSLHYPAESGIQADQSPVLTNNDGDEESWAEKSSTKSHASSSLIPSFLPKKYPVILLLIITNGIFPISFSVENI